jgi:hypothetical protein
MLLQAWLFPMIVRRDMIPLSTLYALLYAAPLLKDGLVFTEYAAAMWLIGIIHIWVSGVLVTGTSPRQLTHMTICSCTCPRAMHPLGSCSDQSTQLHAD